MGPTGEPTQIPENENVLLLGGGLGNAVLFSIGQAMRKNNCNVTYFAGYKNSIDRFKTDEIRDAASNVIWCCDDKELDCENGEYSYKGNILECLEKFSANELGAKTLKEIDRVVVIGSDRMMEAVSGAIQHSYKHLLGNVKVAIGSINSPMQCMMKEICGQCIARHVDSKTGKESYVYSCKNQDQNLYDVDFKHLNKRLSQNSLLEKTSAKIIHNICLGVDNVAS
jgi:NAD(P)H-flavin reductase